MYMLDRRRVEGRDAPRARNRRLLRARAGGDRRGRLLASADARADNANERVRVVVQGAGVDLDAYVYSVVDTTIRIDIQNDSSLVLSSARWCGSAMHSASSIGGMATW